MAVTPKLVTYSAVYRLAARPYALSNAFAAAGRKQYATIHHTAAAVKTVHDCSCSKFITRMCKRVRDI